MSTSYNYAGNLSGCCLRIRSGNTDTTLATTIAATIQALNPTPGHGTDILLSTTNSASFTIATTFPTDLSTAYLEYINEKQAVMYSGGTCTFGGVVQTFSDGYQIIEKNCLISLSGVSGSIESTGVNISFNPTTGFWVETYSKNNHTISIVRAKKACGGCADYNALYMTEMILYHAINNVAWRIMRSTATEYPPGLWLQYQGALYRWNAYTYAAQYVYSLDDTDDTFIVKVGWINTTCTTVYGFAAKVTINLLSYGNTPANFVTYRLLYGGKPRTDGCSPAVGFIANTDTQQVYMYAGGSATEALGGLPLFAEYVNYQVISSLQDFNPATSGGELTSGGGVNMGNWVVGVGGGGSGGYVAGDGYGAMGVQLGFAKKITDDIELSNDAAFKWTYEITRSWEVYKTSGTGYITETYTPADSATVIITGIDEYHSDTEEAPTE